MRFLTQLKKVVNSGQSRSIILTGNIYDLFFDGNKYVPLIHYLTESCKVNSSNGQKGLTQLLLRVNSPIENPGEEGIAELAVAWESLHNRDLKPIKDRFQESIENPVYALELLRQMTQCYRKSPNLRNNLFILIEAADLMLPESEISRMNLADRKRIAIMQDWFCDPNFMNGHDTVVMLAESRSLVHHRVSRLPQVISIEVPLPDWDTRSQFIQHTSTQLQENWGFEKINDLATQTAGLSLQALRQMLLSHTFESENIVAKVEEYMISQLGEGVVEFKRPKHTLKDVIGFTKLKKFMKEELIPAIKATGDKAKPGCAVSGPIGGGKTFVCEAVVAELNMPVIVLKNIRSKWFGETDQILERLQRLLQTFNKIVIFVDEADTMFGDIQSDHDTEKRLTGKIQAMMSDVQLRGRVFWFLMTARIHRLSPDIRRPGRMDLIIPILDPEGRDAEEFRQWTFGQLYTGNETRRKLYDLTLGYSAAMFSMLRSEIKLKEANTLGEVLDIARDILPADISDTREFQILQAKLNCTRASLLEYSEKQTRNDILRDREHMHAKIRLLEEKGVR